MQGEFLGLRDVIVCPAELTCCFMQRRIFDRGYLDSLHEHNMRLTSDPIAEITSNSIITGSGEEIFVDAIVRVLLPTQQPKLTGNI